MNEEYYDEMYEDWDEYDDYDESDYDNDYDDDGDMYWDGGEYEPYQPTLIQRVKNFFRNLYWNIRYKLKLIPQDDIPF